MVYSVSVENYKEFENLIYNKDLNISKAVVDKIFDNLETTKRFIYVLKILIEEEDLIVDLTIDRKDFIDTLEKNIHIHAYHEEYERCAEIRDVIKKLKNKQL